MTKINGIDIMPNRLTIYLFDKFTNLDILSAKTLKEMLK